MIKIVISNSLESFGVEIKARRDMLKAIKLIEQREGKQEAFVLTKFIELENGNIKEIQQILLDRSFFL